jgi:hypothetical protein
MLNRPGSVLPNAESARQPYRHRRPVVDPAGVRHPSIQAAAQAHDLWPAAVYQRCVKRHAGWRFAEPLVEPVPTPGSKG